MVVYIHPTIKLIYLGNMPKKPKKVTFKYNAEDRQWSNKVLKEVIFPEIYERYGPNAEPNMQLPSKILEGLRREVYGEASSSKSAINGEPNQDGKK